MTQTLLFVTTFVFGTVVLAVAASMIEHDRDALRHPQLYVRAAVTYVVTFLGLGLVYLLGLDRSGGYLTTFSLMGFHWLIVAYAFQVSNLRAILYVFTEWGLLVCTYLGVGVLIIVARPWFS